MIKLLLIYLLLTTVAGCQSTPIMKAGTCFEEWVLVGTEGDFEVYRRDMFYVPLRRFSEELSTVTTRLYPVACSEFMQELKRLQLKKNKY